MADEQVTAIEEVAAAETAAENIEHTEAAGAEERRVPVGEAIRYRKRAQEAESKAGELSSRVQELESTLEQTRGALDSVERRHEIDLALLRAEAVDLETTRLLTELAVTDMDDPDVGIAVSELRRRKPFLFRARRDRAGHAASTMSGSTRQAGTSSNGLVEAAETATKSGDRGALLSYLRARRGV